LYPSADTQVKDRIHLPYDGPAETITLLGTEEKLEWTRDSGGISVQLPMAAITAAAPIAHVFRIVTR
jgi:hypothetical protein